MSGSTRASSSEASDAAPGTVEMMIHGQPTLTPHTGDPFLMPPHTPHNALDVGPETGQLLSTYIVEVDQPLARFVK